MTCMAVVSSDVSGASITYLLGESDGYYIRDYGSEPDAAHKAYFRARFAMPWATIFAIGEVETAGGFTIMAWWGFETARGYGDWLRHR